MNLRRTTAGLLCVGLVAGASTALLTGEATAADHIDSPSTMSVDNRTADILDFYAWHSDNDRIIAIITYAALIEGGADPEYSGDVVYGIHIDNDLDNVADNDVWVRFGQNGNGDWGVKVEGLPGVADPVIGPVNTAIEAGPGAHQVWAGMAEDPFFFDLDGYLATLETGTLMFDSTNDTFAGFNVMSIVVEISIDGASGGNNDIQLWATTRK